MEYLFNKKENIFTLTPIKYLPQETISMLENLEKKRHKIEISIDGNNIKDRYAIKVFLDNIHIGFIQKRIWNLDTHRHKWQSKDIYSKIDELVIPILLNSTNKLSLLRYIKKDKEMELKLKSITDDRFLDMSLEKFLKDRLPHLSDKDKFFVLRFIKSNDLQKDILVDIDFN